MDINPQTREILVNLLKLTSPEVILRGDVDADMEGYVFWAFAYLRSVGSPGVKVTVDSGGGSATRGQSIYDIIRLYEGQTTALVLSDAHSAASLIVQGCARRTMTRHAKMCIHNPSKQSVSLDVLSNTKRRTKLVSELTEYQRALIQGYMHRTGQTERVIKKKLAEDVMMTAQEALDFGLIDEIV
jgi:ATP-dependent Clp protease protease subunit